MFNTMQLHCKEEECTHLATCNGCSLWRVCLSAARSHRAGGARPVSDSLIPAYNTDKLRRKQPTDISTPPHTTNLRPAPAGSFLRDLQNTCTHIFDGLPKKLVSWRNESCVAVPAEQADTSLAIAVYHSAVWPWLQLGFTEVPEITVFQEVSGKVLNSASAFTEGKL